MSAAHTPRNFSEPRRSVVEKARQAWIRRLIDLSRRNNPFYYRPLKTGTLDLSLADGDRMAALLSGETVPRVAQTSFPDVYESGKVAPTFRWAHADLKVGATCSRQSHRSVGGATGCRGGS